MWKDYRPARYDNIIGQLDKGGLRLIDLVTKDYSLKTYLVKKALMDPGASCPVYHDLPIKDEIIWKCNITDKEIATKYGNSFGLYVWQAWAKFSLKILHIWSCLSNAKSDQLGQGNE